MRWPGSAGAAGRMGGLPRLGKRLAHGLAQFPAPKSGPAGSRRRVLLALHPPGDLGSGDWRKRESARGDRCCEVV
jgi:hypothetical protein